MIARPQLNIEFSRNQPKTIVHVPWCCMNNKLICFLLDVSYKRGKTDKQNFIEKFSLTSNGYINSICAPSQATEEVALNENLGANMENWKNFRGKYLNILKISHYMASFRILCKYSLSVLLS